VEGSAGGFSSFLICTGGWVGSKFRGEKKKGGFLLQKEGSFSAHSGDHLQDRRRTKGEKYGKLILQEGRERGGKIAQNVNELEKGRICLNSKE